MSTRSSDDRIGFVETIPFAAVHVLAVAGVVYYGWSWSGFALAMSVYAVLMFAVTAGLHRYFSHRSYKTGRVFQFVLAVLGTITAQKGVLWWAAHHRHHHKHSDEPDDVHSPIQRGFWWAHVGWILVERHNDIRWDKIPDLARYPELRWLQKHEMKFVVGFAAAMFVVPQLFGVSGAWSLLWGFFVMQTLLWHGTFTINSFTHLWGRKRYASGDHSRNSLLFALITHGEGWHNNHHYYQRSTSQGFYWWEIDVSYYVLKMLSWTRLVWDVSRPPRHVRDARQPLTELDDHAAVDGDETVGRDDERIQVELPNLGQSIDQVRNAG
jgi:stearoyl-CoA desaturase (delta-9 desaturase)